MRICHFEIDGILYQGENEKILGSNYESFCRINNHMPYLRHDEGRLNQKNIQSPHSQKYIRI